MRTQQLGIDGSPQNMSHTLETELRMNDITAVRHAVDQLLDGRLDPLLELLTEQVEFEVAGADEVSRGWTASGTQAVVDYFTALGSLPAFWQIDYSGVGGEVIAWGKEAFTVEGCELEGECEFALVFKLRDGRIVRLLVIEDLLSFIRGGGWLPIREAA